MAVKVLFIVHVEECYQSHMDNNFHFKLAKYAHNGYDRVINLNSGLEHQYYQEHDSLWSRDDPETKYKESEPLGYISNFETWQWFPMEGDEAIDEYEDEDEYRNWVVIDEDEIYLAPDEFDPEEWKDWEIHTAGGFRDDCLAKFENILDACDLDYSRMVAY